MGDTIAQTLHVHISYTIVELMTGEWTHHILIPITLISIGHWVAITRSCTLISKDTTVFWKVWWAIKFGILAALDNLSNLMPIKCWAQCVQSCQTSSIVAYTYVCLKYSICHKHTVCAKGMNHIRVRCSLTKEAEQENAHKSKFLCLKRTCRSPRSTAWLDVPTPDVYTSEKQ